MKKFFLAFAAMLMAFSVSAADPNIYASGLKAGAVVDNKVEISYVLNAEATDFLTVNFYNGTERVYTLSIEDAALKTKGAHTATIDLSAVPAGTYTWAIEAGAAQRATISTELLNMSDGTYWQPRDMAIDKNPESPFFGQWYVTNSANGGGDAYVGNKTAIYTFNSLLELQGVYDGGIAWNTNNGPHRLYIDEAGLVYASNRSDTDGGIFIMDPANPTAAFKSLFDPAKRGETYKSITGFDFAGEGADRVLVTADGVTYSGGSVGNILKYAIGETKENFAGAPDTLGTAGKYSLGNQHNQIAHDGRGGWWIAQNRSAEGGLQCLMHMTADGTKDYTSNGVLGLGHSAAGALAVSDDYTLLAMAADNGIKVFAITWGEDGKPALELKYYTGSLANNMTGVEFDYAGNILTGSLSSERLYMFALPSDNYKETPAPKASTITVEAVVVDEATTYNKVTEAPADWTGTYVIAYEATETEAKVFNGLDVASGFTAATIANGAIKAAGLVEVEIAAVEGGYSIKMLGSDNAGKYISGTSGSNKLNFTDDAQLNTLALEADGVLITSNTSVLRYNNASNQERFRYYKSTSYTGQKPVQLYKKAEAAAPAPQPTELWLTPGWGEIVAGGEMFMITANFDVELTEEQLAENLKWTANKEGVTFMGVNPVYVTVGAEVEAGQLMITATYGEVEMTGYYTVIAGGPQGISIDPFNNIEIEAGKTLQLTAALYPEDATDAILWTSSDETLATVSTTGLVTSLSPEKDTTVTITATVENYPDIFASVTVKLLAPVPVEPITLYAKMEHGWWTSDGTAAIGCYYWGEGIEGPAWPGIRMTPVEGEASLWTITIPGEVQNVIFTRVNANDCAEGDENCTYDWGAQTADLVIPTDGNNLYTITSAEATWGGGEGAVKGEWSKYVEPLKFVLNGGVILPTNEALWELFKPAYNTYYSLTRADQTIDKVSTFAASKMVDFMTKDDSPWKWLGDYVMPISVAQGYALDATSGESAWRWTIHAFFNCSAAGTLAVKVAGFTEAGQPSAWVSACPLDLGLEPTFESVPVKEGYKFTGWYSDEACTVQVTEAPETGTLYAGWALAGLNGVYTVGGEGADFASLAEAAARVNAAPIEGNVTLAIAADLQEATNCGLVNATDFTVTIRPATAEMRTITFNATADNSGPSGSIVIGSSDPVAGANEVATKNVVIDGAAEGSDVRNLTIVHNNNTGRIVVYGGASDITIQNIISRNTSVAASGSAIQFRGNTGKPGKVLVKGNLIEAANLGMIVHFSNGLGATIEDNIFDMANTMANDYSYGVHGYTVEDTVIVRGNQFINVTTADAQGVLAVSAQGGTWIIENNYFSGMDYTGAEGVATRINYIRPIAGPEVIIRHNTFYIPSFTVKPANADNNVAALEITSGATPVIENNIFVSAEETAQHAFFNITSPTAVNNNVFYMNPNNAKAFVVDALTPAAYVEANATNKVVEVHFTDAAKGDLSLAAESDGDKNLAVPAIAEVATDIMGKARHAELVYAGAWEGGDFKTDDTALENTEVKNANVRKVFENGNIYIIREGVKYTTSGIVVE